MTITAQALREIADDLDRAELAAMERIHLLLDQEIIRGDEKVGCPICGALMLPKGVAIHLARKHGEADSRPMGPRPMSVGGVRLP